MYIARRRLAQTIFVQPVIREVDRYPAAVRPEAVAVQRGVFADRGLGERELGLG